MPCQHVICAQSIPYEAMEDIRHRISQCEQYHPSPMKGKSQNTDKPNFDGPINPDTWFIPTHRSSQTTDRIMFILKEPWGDGGVDWPDILLKRNNMYDFIDDGGQSTYKPMVILANMIGTHSAYNDIINQLYSANVYTVFKESCGIMEVNKFSGDKSSDDAVITDYAKKNLDLLSEQIQVYNPNIIIIGIGKNASNILIHEDNMTGTYKIFGETVVADKRNLQYPQSEHYCSYATDNRIYIVTYHPSYTENYRPYDTEKYCNAIYEAVKTWKLQHK